MLQRLLPWEWRRQRLLRRITSGPLHDYLMVPFAAAKLRSDHVPFIALDLETTGLDATHDEILSIGSVTLQHGTIDLATARHQLVQPTRAIPEASAVIHQITDDTAATGLPLAEAMAALLPQLAGKVLLAHHAKVELGFLGRACQQLYGAPLLLPTVDTQYLQRRSWERRNHAYGGSDLRLGRLRERYQLPRYRAHDALIDAIATAELFLAQLAERGRTPPPLGQLLLPQ